MSRRMAPPPPPDEDFEDEPPEEDPEDGEFEDDPEEEFDDEEPPPDDDEEGEFVDDEEGEFEDEPEEEGEFEDDEEAPPDDEEFEDEEEEFDEEEDEFDDDEPVPPEDEDFDDEEEPADDEDEPEDDEPEDDEEFDDEEEPEDDIEDFEDDAPPSPPSPGTQKKGLKLPVSGTANKKKSVAGTKKSVGAPANVDLGALSSGLAVKDAPQLFRNKSVSEKDAKRVSVKDPAAGTAGKNVDENKAPSAGVNESESTAAAAAKTRQASVAEVRRSILAGVVPLAGNNTRASFVATAGTVAPVVDEVKPETIVRQQALEKGYLSALGKFEGDPFEQLYIKIDPDTNKLHVIVEQGQEAEFDLAKKSYVFEDSQDPTSFILDYHKMIVVFKVDSVNTFNTVMKGMPPNVFMVAEMTEAEQKLVKEKEDRKAKKVVPMHARSHSTNSTINRKKGTSVEDLLEEGFEGQNFSKEQLDLMFQNGPGLHYQDRDTLSVHSTATQFNLTPQRRKELIETHLLKPKYSIRRVILLCEWVNSCHLWPNPVSVETLHREMCNGMLLCKLVKMLNPDLPFVNLNERALTKKAALENLEQALGHLWRSKALNSTRIPSAMAIYSGSTSKIAILLNEVFQIYVQKPLYKNAIKILKWCHYILKQYLRPLPDAVFDEGDLSSVWPHFQSGTALFCIFYHLYGPNVIGEGENEIRIDPLRVAGEPTSICDFRDNLNYAFALCRALNIDVLWTAEDWITHPDTEFILLQLSFIYEALKNRQCSLPPAQGGHAGLTSGPNGEPIVAGLIFSDTRPPTSRVLVQKKKAVLLGYDKDSMPLLPVDRGGKTGRFVQNGYCPLGMVSNNAQVNQIAIHIKESKVHSDRSQWNKSASMLTEQESFVDGHIVSLLREHNKRGEDGKPLSPTKSKAQVGSAAAGAASAGAGGAVGSGASGAAAKTSTSGGMTNEQRAKQIEIAVKNLEKEMQQSQTQLTALEDDLANRYLELESAADNCEVTEYEQALDNLEVERKELEEEKLRLQEHFARKLESIKEIYKEVEHRQKAESAASAAAAGGASASGGSSPKKGAISGSTGSGKNKPIAPPPSSYVHQEKGWIKTTKMSNHNFHLKNLELASSAALKNTWTPKSIKEKEKARAEEAKREQYATQQKIKQAAAAMHNNVILRPELPAHIVEASEKLEQSELMIDQLSSTSPHNQQQLSQEEYVERAFNKFKYRLHIVSLKAQSSKQMSGRAKLQDYLQKAAKTPTVVPISLPEKSFHTTAADTSADASGGANLYHTAEMQQLSAAIREDELHRMHYEDERRRLVLAEQQLQHSYSVSQKIVGGQGGRSAAAGQSQGQQQQQQGGSSGKFASNMDAAMNRLSDGDVRKKPSAAEVDLAFKWLSINRKLILADRTPKEFVFAMTNNSSGGGDTQVNSRSSHANKAGSYVFEWFELVSTSPTDHQLYLMGSVAVEDIREINESKSDPCLFSIVINGDNTRALKNTKGRVIIPIQCDSPAECGKYMSSLICMKRFVM